MEINGTMCDEGKEWIRERIKNLWKKTHLVMQLANLIYSTILVILTNNFSKQKGESYV